MITWLIVSIYVAFVLALTGWISYLFIVDRMPQWLPFGMFVVVVATGFISCLAIDRFAATA